MVEVLVNEGDGGWVLETGMLSLIGECVGLEVLDSQGSRGKGPGAEMIVRVMPMVGADCPIAQSLERLEWR